MKSQLAIALGMLALGAVEAQNFTVNVDYLYWIASQDDMNYAVAFDDINTLANGFPKYQRSDWNSGVRIGAGYTIPCSWEAYFSWTRFHNSVKGKVASDFIVANQLLLPSFGSPIIGGSGANLGPAKSSWNLNFDKFDLDFGYALVDNCTYTLQPTIGIRGLIVTQSQHMTYTNFYDSNTQTNNINAFANLKDSFWGIGPSAGLNNTLNIGYGLSLLGEFSFAAFYGRLKTFSDKVIEETEDFPFTFTLNQNKLIPAFRLFFGMEWGTTFSYCYPFAVAFGYETQYLWGIWRTENSGINNFYITNSGYSALQLSGITARVSFGF